jgi:PAS domain S-box-containing protein
MSATWIEPVDILLVDDRPENLTALTLILDQPGYRLITATSGSDALKLVLKEQFAVIVLDVVMPIMDGFEVASLIKSRQRSSHIPIIFLTAAGVDMDRIHEAYSLGAVDYLMKPVAPQVLQAKVAVFVELHRKTEEIKRQAELLREHDQRERERQLAELRAASERRYSDLVEAIPQLVWRADRGGAVDYLSRRWREHTGMSDEESRGWGWVRAIHPEDRERLRAEWLSAIGAGARFQAECRLRGGADGTFRWHLCQALPERGHAGEVIGWLGTYTDVDAQKRADEEREELLRRAEKARAEAERAIGARDEFLSIASHELRTPVTSLKLQIQLLARSLRGEGRVPFSIDNAAAKVEIAEHQIERLATLIAALLDVSRIGAGQLVIEPRETDLSRMARDVAARFADTSAIDGGSIEVEADEPVIGRWDPMRLEQVITNLIANALKYGPGCPIEVRVRSTPSSAVLSVRDHGIGIASENIERIFDRFERAVSPAAYGGLGLGLYITRHIVAAHGGSIHVASEPGEGAEFRVTLPLDAGAAGPRPAHDRLSPGAELC